MQVAGGSGIQQDRPGDIAAIFLAHFFLLGPTDHGGVHEEIDGQCVEYSRVNVGEQAADKGVVRMLWICDCLPDHLSLTDKFAAGKFICPIHYFRQILIGILVQIMKQLLQSKAFQ